MVPNLNHNYINSSSNYYLIIIVQDLKNSKSKIFNTFFISRNEVPSACKQQPRNGCCLHAARYEMV